MFVESPSLFRLPAFAGEQSLLLASCSLLLPAQGRNLFNTVRYIIIDLAPVARKTFSLHNKVINLKLHPFP